MKRALIVGLIGLVAIEPSRAALPEELAEARWRWLMEETSTRPELGAFFASNRWTAAALEQAWGRPVTGGGGESLWPVPGDGILTVTWDAQGLPARLSVTTKPTRGDRATAPWPMALAGWRASLSGLASQRDLLGVLGRPTAWRSEAWVFEVGPSERVLVTAFVPHWEGHRMSLEVSWYRSAPELPGEPGWPADATMIPQPGVGLPPSAPVPIEMLMPFGLRPGMSAREAAAALGVPTRWRDGELEAPGLALAFDGGGLARIEAQAGLAAVLPGAPGDLWRRALADPWLVAATFGHEPKPGWGWHFEGETTSLAIDFDHRGGLEWRIARVAPGACSDTPDRPPEPPAPFALPPDLALVSDGGDSPRAAPLLRAFGGPGAALLQARLGHRLPCWSRRGLEVANRPGYGFRISPELAGLARAAFPEDPVASALGQPAATWVERFGAPTRRGTRQLEWLFVGPDDVPVIYTVSAWDVAGRGVIDAFAIARSSESFDHLLTGLLTIAPGARLDRLGPPDSPGRWRGGEITWDAATGTLTLAPRDAFEHPVAGRGAAAFELRSWLRERGIEGPLLRALGTPVNEAYASLHFASPSLRAKGASLFIELGRGERAALLECGPPSMRCDRLQLSPKDLVK